MTKWKLVPVEPDEAMADAAQAVPAGIGGCPPHWAHIYRAMIAASPAPPDVVAVLERLLQEFDFLIEHEALPEIRDDVIFVQARALIAQLKGEAK